MDTQFLKNPQLTCVADFSPSPQDKTVDVFVAGNLVWYLVAEGELTELKLMLEAGMLDTTVCLPQQTRGLLAATLTAKFG